MMQLTPEAIRRSVRELPALPAVVLELIQSLGDSEVSAEQLAAKISQDQAIAAKTLRLANSSRRADSLRARTRPLPRRSEMWRPR